MSCKPLGSELEHVARYIVEELGEKRHRLPTHVILLIGGHRKIAEVERLD